MLFGTGDGEKPWKDTKVKWLFPVPGYDRHFLITEKMGFELVNIPMDKNGPDMDMVEKLVVEDDTIKGIWCVPMYANPTGTTYSDEVVKRLAAMKTKAKDFKIFWDNAYDADFVFVTEYPSKKRPFYAMDDPEDKRYTKSFDLLFHGLEITTGGQRIHDYKMLSEKIAARGMTEEGMEQYLSAFKHGMPPHGGLGIGLERLTMKLIGEDNVRETTLFPRDLTRLEP